MSTTLPPSRADRALAWRCPRCMVRYPTRNYVCLGGWPDANGRPAVEHVPVRVALIPT